MTPGRPRSRSNGQGAVGCLNRLRQPPRENSRRRQGMRRLISLIAAFSALVLATNVVWRAPNEILTLGDERVVPNAMVQATLRFTPGMIKSASGDELTWTHDDQTTAPHGNDRRGVPGGRPSSRLRVRRSRRAVRGSPRSTTCSARSSTPEGRARRTRRLAPVLRRHVDLGGGHRALGHDVAVPVRDPSLDAGQDRRRVATSLRPGAGSRTRSVAAARRLLGSGSGSEISPAMVVDTSIAPARGVSGVDAARLG